MTNFGAPFPQLPDAQYQGTTGSSTIYVHKDTGDDDTGDGSLSNPYQSVTRAAKDISVPLVLERSITIQLQETTPLDPWDGADADWVINALPNFDSTADFFDNFVRIKGSEAALGPGTVTVNAVAANATNPTLTDLTIDEDLTGVSIVQGRSYVAQQFLGDFLTCAVAIDNGGAVGTHVITVKDPTSFFFATQSLRFFASTTLVHQPTVTGFGWLLQGITFGDLLNVFHTYGRTAPTGVSNARIQGCGWQNGPGLTQIVDCLGVRLEECQWNVTTNSQQQLEGVHSISSFYAWSGSDGGMECVGFPGGSGLLHSDVTIDTGSSVNWICEGGKHTFPAFTTFFKDAGVAVEVRDASYIEDRAIWYTDGCTSLATLSTGCVWDVDQNPGQPASQSHTGPVFSLGNGCHTEGTFGKYNTTHTSTGSDVQVDGVGYAWADLPITDATALSKAE